MHGRRGVLIAIGVLALLTGSSTGAFALVDDFETDFWLPYTDFLLGDKASAGYASTFARSGTRSFHVDISGYSILDFGCAYGYAGFPSQGAAMTELRGAILYDRLEDTPATDAVADGLSDLDEESRVYSMSVTSGSTPMPIPSSGTAMIEIQAPPVDGIVQWAGVGLEVEHPRPGDLSVELTIPGKSGSQLLWDPGFHARGAAILEPTSGAAVRGTVEVRGRAWHADPFVVLYVDGVWIADMRGLEDGSLLIPWSSDGWPHGGPRLGVIAQAVEVRAFVSPP